MSMDTEAQCWRMASNFRDTDTAKSNFQVNSENLLQSPQFTVETNETQGDVTCPVSRSWWCRETRSLFSGFSTQQYYWTPAGPPSRTTPGGAIYRKELVSPRVCNTTQSLTVLFQKGRGKRVRLFPPAFYLCFMLWNRWCLLMISFK